MGVEKGEKKERPLIHPDFKIEDNEGDGFSWWWNYTDFNDYLRKKPREKYDSFGMIKVAFPFDDPTSLDNCPFMCKIGENATSNPDTRWFGVAYAYKDDAENLKAWASKFPRWELITKLTPHGETWPGVSKSEKNSAIKK